ncbi:hypothetical protein [Succinivibrio sp.]|uniref:hypothetical protein n=1 Tax=Succinivibrio sp. TaxID=2053619 RepID=UPI0025FAFC6A|nr:hypothetical protein [Succinivibrio sp.]MBQ9221957.1 hypothetical protein [Succinivibrio sp.]
MNALKYEYFVTKTFGSERGADPARVGDANYYNNVNDKNYLNKVRIGLAYTISRKSSELINTKQVRDPDDYVALDNLIDRALNVKNSQHIDAVIDDAQKLFDELEKLPNRW